MKRAVTALLSLLALLVLGIVIVAFAVPSDRLMTMLEQRLKSTSKETGVAISILDGSQLTLFPTIQFDSSLVTIETPATEDTVARRTALEGITVTTNWWQLATNPRFSIAVDRATFDPLNPSGATTGLDAIISRLEFTAFRVVVVPTADDLSMPILEARLLGGQLQSQLTIGSGTDESKISSSGVIDEALASEVLAVLGSSIIPSGFVDLAWDIEGIQADATLEPPEIFGEATLEGSDLGLSQINLELELCNAYNRASGRPTARSASTSTPIRSLSAIYNLDGYRVDITDLELAIPGLVVTGVTTIDRTNQNFDAKLQAVVGEDFGEQIPNCKIDQRLRAIEWPIRCRGNLIEDDLRSWCSVELESLLRRGLESELKRRLNDGGVESLLRSLIPRST